MKLYPPVLVLAGIGVQLGLGYLAPVEPILARIWQYIGVVLMLLSFAFTVYMVRRFTKSATTILPDGKPSALMQDGVFAHSRNPTYVAMVLLLTGSALAIGQLWGLLVVPVFIVLVHHLWIVKEEENLEAAFGQIYRNYKMKVRRWL